MAGALNETPLLELRGIRKSFSGVEVLHGVDFALRRGEIHGLAGSNGAGKSTLMKILNGVYHPDEGSILIEGRPCQFRDPLDASELGIAMVFQEFSLVPTMTVTQNIYLNREPKGAFGLIDEATCRAGAERVLSHLQVKIPASAELGSLSVGNQQIVELAKALSQNAKLLILDEPTASLSKSEIDALFSLLRRFKAEGYSIIIITHHLQEIMDLCDRVTVLRDGKVVLARETREASLSELIAAIAGREVKQDLRDSAGRSTALIGSGQVLLRVNRLTREGEYRDVSFELRSGEVLGIVGLLGSGRTEILKTIYGLQRQNSGAIELKGTPVSFTHPADARRAGVTLVSENRLKNGTIRGQSIMYNILLPIWRDFRKGPFIDDSRALTTAASFIEKLSIKCEGPDQPIEQLSGGNQQKAMLARAMAGEMVVLLLDDPSVGVDIASRQEILHSIRAIADAGAGIILVSSDPEELVQVCDRAIVLKDGEVLGELSRDGGSAWTEETIEHAAQGML